MLNLTDVPWLGEGIKTTLYECAFTPRNRVPTVPEKQVDRIRNEAKHRLQIYVGGKYKVNIRKRCKAAYRETKSPPCLGGVKQTGNPCLLRKLKESSTK